MRSDKASVKGKAKGKKKTKKANKQRPLSQLAKSRDMPHMDPTRQGGNQYYMMRDML